MYDDIEFILCRSDQNAFNQIADHPHVYFMIRIDYINSAKSQRKGHDSSHYVNKNAQRRHKKKPFKIRFFWSVRLGPVVKPSGKLNCYIGRCTKKSLIITVITGHHVGAFIPKWFFEWILSAFSLISVVCGCSSTSRFFSLEQLFFENFSSSCQRNQTMRIKIHYSFVFFIAKWKVRR